MASEGRLKPAEVDRSDGRGHKPPPSFSGSAGKELSDSTGSAQRPSSKLTRAEQENEQLRSEVVILRSRLELRAGATFQPETGAPVSELSEALEELDLLRLQYAESQMLLANLQRKLGSGGSTEPEPSAGQPSLRTQLEKLSSTNAALLAAAESERNAATEASARSERLALELLSLRRQREAQEQELADTQRQLLELHQLFRTEVEQLNAALVEEQQSVLSAQGALNAARRQVALLQAGRAMETPSSKATAGSDDCEPAADTTINRRHASGSMPVTHVSRRTGEPSSRCDDETSRAKTARK